MMKALLTVTGDDVTIERISASSETMGDDVVLPDATLARIGVTLGALDFPIDGAVPDGSAVLYDTEWKVLEDGRLVIKQIRPFVRE